jgi:ribosome-dependent ATPase
MLSFLLLVVQSQLVFAVPIKGSFAALSLGAFLYVITTTGIGLLMSTFTRTQIAALFGTAILTILPTVSFSGLTTPVGALEGLSYWIGQGFPASYFLIISRGTYTKALGVADLWPQFVALAAFIPLLTVLSVVLLKKQEA